MFNKSDFFVEVDNFQRVRNGQSASSEVCLQKRTQNRTILVLAGVMGNGIKANVTANVIASMALNYIELRESPVRFAESIIKTFSGSSNSANKNGEILPKASISVIDVHSSGLIKILEFGYPRHILIRNETIIENHPKSSEIQLGNDDKRTMYMSEFQAIPEDRLIIVSHGVVASGSGTPRMPEGWGRDGVINIMGKSIVDNNIISAHTLSRAIIARAEMNDMMAVKCDMSCFSIYFRQPRKMLICSGPPFNEENDKNLADMIANYKGFTMICGGTTAQIVSRELNREINVNLKRDPAGLPPTSSMDGVSLITEGVLTLNKVKAMLEKITDSDISEQGTDADVCRMLLAHDKIDFVVGTRINPIHQDPNLPVELELRRNIIKEMGRILETKFMKSVDIRFM